MVEEDFNYEEYFQKLLSIINDYDLILNCHLTDFIVDDLWHKCLPYGLRCDLEKIGEDISSFENFQSLPNDFTDLLEFLHQLDSLRLKNCPGVLKVDDFLNTDEIICNNKNINHKINEFMGNKKKYEIEIFTQVVAHLARLNSNLVIDVGAGKGYLATSLYEKFKIPVLAIDCCEMRHKGAVNRQKLIEKQKHQSFSSVQHTVKYIDDTIDYSQLVKSAFKDNNEFTKTDNFLLTGLHACGSLALEMIRSFLQSDCLNSHCVVSCCYHLTDESLTGMPKLTKNSRMLAQQCVDRFNNTDNCSSVFYRAVLQVLLETVGQKDARVGRGAPTTNFPVYAKWALTKIGVSNDQIPSLDDLQKFYDNYVHKKWQLQAFHFLRIHLGSILEAAIIIDRFLYLKRSQKCSKVSIVQLFDPAISPRCYSIIALK